MTEHKYTDEKVIRALERCVEGTSEACHVCTFGINPPYPVCKTMVEKLALDLINRQKAEIKQYKCNEKDLIRLIDEARQDCAVAEHNHALAVIEREANVKGFTDALKTIKVDVVKEFAERLKKELTTGAAVMRISTLDIIDYLVKEFTEEKT